ncbi:hypothetical protein SO802_025093 [Lithocarpus litseifolius]|uniref:Uncharacterized protein n=1 Tax=Lithocarpus litseifolius TaxID=425828 RepID=A0AAW2BXW8_9ROSI
MGFPASLDVGASVPQESLESVGQAIDDIGSSVWKSTVEIITHGANKFFLATAAGFDSDSVWIWVWFGFAYFGFSEDGFAFFVFVFLLMFGEISVSDVTVGTEMRRVFQDRD